MATYASATHSPIPWHLNTADGRIPSVRKIRQPYGEASVYRATIQSGRDLVCSLDFGYGKAADAANAEFILRACNMHEQLVSFLEFLLTPDAGTYPDIKSRIHDLLVEAGGRT